MFHRAARSVQQVADLVRCLDRFPADLAQLPR
jgi:hypothetical protein